MADDYFVQKHRYKRNDCHNYMDGSSNFSAMPEMLLAVSVYRISKITCMENNKLQPL